MLIGGEVYEESESSSDEDEVLTDAEIESHKGWSDEELSYTNYRLCYKTFLYNYDI